MSELQRLQDVNHYKFFFVPHEPGCMLTERQLFSLSAAALLRMSVSVVPLKKK